MRPSFNIAGPCLPGMHYMRSPARRMQSVLRFVEEEKYFILRAGPRSGKTTAARWLVGHLNADGRYAAAWVDLQTAREEPEVKAAMAIILEELERALLRDLPELSPLPDRSALLALPATALVRYLQQVCTLSSRPVVLLLDEAEALVGPAMSSFLTQVRSGFMDRASTPFPNSIALIGMRSVHGYSLPPDDHKTSSWLGNTSPFNITAETTVLEPFTAYDISELLSEHVATTGQRFQPVAVKLLFELTQGQPWLVNAMAEQIVSRDVENRSVSISPNHVNAAKEAIILRRRTHIESLATRLREDRVRRVLEPMLIGDPLPPDLAHEDLSYALELGIVSLSDQELVIANPIYREIIPRVLTYVQQVGLHQQTEWYLRADGSLDLVKLLAAFQELWRKHGQMAADGFRYREAGPHLVLTAFLQRIVQKGGKVEHDYAIGRGSLGLTLTWGEERHVVEVAVRRDGKTNSDVRSQVTSRLEQAGLDEGTLVLFDRESEAPWEDRLFLNTLEVAGKRLHLVGC
jgi:hypothetical protein